MLTAKEARIKAEPIAEALEIVEVELELKSIMGQISEKIEQGKFELYVSYDPYQRSIDRLHELGYNIVRLSSREEEMFNYKISW